MKVLLFANTEWYLYNFRLGFARFLRERGFDVVMMSPRGPYGKRLEEDGFRWIPLDMDRRSLNPLRELRLLGHIVGVLRDEAPDLVHNFTIKCVVYGSLAAVLAGVRARVNAVTGLGYVFIGKGLRARLLRLVVGSLLRRTLGGKSARLILQNGDDLAAFVQSGLALPHAVRLIRGSGVNTSRFFPRVGDRQELHMKVLLASRLLWDKGVGEYADAAHRLKQKGLAIDFLLAGNTDPGNPAAVSSQQVDIWRTEGIVEPLGHVEDMPAILVKTDVMVLPSYREGLPRCLIEAAACGLPIVTTDAPGCREVVEDGVNGYLVPPRDPAALADAIRRLHADPELRRKMGRAGREKVLREFDERVVFDATLAVYWELLGKPVNKAGTDTMGSFLLSHPAAGSATSSSRLLQAGHSPKTSIATKRRYVQMKFRGADVIKRIPSILAISGQRVTQ